MENILLRENSEQLCFECDEVITKIWRKISDGLDLLVLLLKIKDKLFCIEWEEGLTEYQDNCFWEQPYEVEEVERTVVVKDYIKKK